MQIDFLTKLSKKASSLIKNKLVLKEANLKINHFVTSFKTTNEKVIINVHLTSKKLHNTILLKNSLKNNKTSYISSQMTIEHKDNYLFMRSSTKFLKTHNKTLIQKEIKSIIKNNSNSFSVVDLVEGWSRPLNDLSEKIDLEDDQFSETD
jgi:hypothetical protein